MSISKVQNTNHYGQFKVACSHVSSGKLKLMYYALDRKIICKNILQGQLIHQHFWYVLVLIIGILFYIKYKFKLNFQCLNIFNFDTNYQVHKIDVLNSLII